MKTILECAACIAAMILAGVFIWAVSGLAVIILVGWK